MVEVELQPDLKKTLLLLSTKVACNDSEKCEVNSECKADAKDSSHLPITSINPCSSTIFACDPELELILIK